MMALLQQLLYSESLSLSWRDIIVPVVRQVVQTVRPDVRNCDDDMDIRQLVHIKKVRRRPCAAVQIKRSRTESADCWKRVSICDSDSWRQEV